MKIRSISYKMACWTLILGGIGHTMADLTAPKTAEQNEFILRMKEFTGQILGTEFNLFSFHQGFSLMMGLLLFGYGALNLLIFKNNQGTHLPSNILILNIIIALGAVILSLKYFFLVPVVLTAIAFLGFVISFSTRNRSI